MTDTLTPELLTEAAEAAETAAYEHRPTLADRAVITEAIDQAAQSGQLIEGGKFSLPHPHDGTNLDLTVIALGDGFAIARSTDDLPFAIYSETLVLPEAPTEETTASTKAAAPDAADLDAAAANKSSVETPTQDTKVETV